MGFNQNSTFGFGGSGSGGGGGTVDSANNGTSLTDTTVVLGNDAGQTDAELTNTREIPLNGNTVDFTDVGTGGTVQIAPAAINLNNAPSTVNFNNADGAVTNSAGQGITLFNAAQQIDMGSVPSPGISDSEVFAQVRGNTSVQGWLLNQIRVNSSQDDVAATAADSGTLYVKVPGMIVIDRNVTLPAAVPGLLFHFGYSGNGTDFIKVLPDGTDFIWYGLDNPIPTAAGGGIQNNNAGVITLVCIVAGEWLNMSQTDDGWSAI